MSKIAVIFPGIGYHADKPLLYYSAKLATAKGYDIVRVSYPECSFNLKGAGSEQIRSFAGECLATAAEALKDISLFEKDDVLFVSKSIGTVVATAYASGLDVKVRHVLFTPLEETFGYADEGCGIAFNGTKDNWADCEIIRSLSEKKNIPIMTFEGGNHSIETGDALTDISNLKTIITSIDRFM